MTSLYHIWYYIIVLFDTALDSLYNKGSYILTTSALSPCLIVCVQGVKRADTSCRLLTQQEFQMTATSRRPCRLPSCKNSRTRNQPLSVRYSISISRTISWCWKNAKSHYLNQKTLLCFFASTPHILLCLRLTLCSPAATATSDSNLIHFLNLLSAFSAVMAHEGETLKPRLSVLYELQWPRRQMFELGRKNLSHGFMNLRDKPERKKERVWRKKLTWKYLKFWLVVRIKGHAFSTFIVITSVCTKGPAVKWSVLTMKESIFHFLPEQPLNSRRRRSILTHGGHCGAEHSHPWALYYLSIPVLGFFFLFFFFTLGQTLLGMGQCEILPWMVNQDNPEHKYLHECL